MIPQPTKRERVNPMNGQNNQPNPKLAVLIDADNAQASIIQQLFLEISRYGVATVKRIYGDWTSPNLRSWKEALNDNAVQPIQQFAYTTGKNSTDSAMIIDAMDLLHSGRVEGFCLVSSDSDFTRLATRIRESGLLVYGFGEHKTPKAFVAACDKFVYTEILRDGHEPRADKPGLVVPQLPLDGALRNAITAATREDGWALLASVGNFLTKTNPEFDSRNYGFEKLGELVRAQSFVEVKAVPAGDGERGPPRLYVRINERGTPNKIPMRKGDPVTVS
jgi:uncharacterized LabA/DUF88 family protein